MTDLSNLVSTPETMSGYSFKETPITPEVTYITPEVTYFRFHRNSGATYCYRAGEGFESAKYHLVRGELYLLCSDDIAEKDRSYLAKPGETLDLASRLVDVIGIRSGTEFIAVTGIKVSDDLDQVVSIPGGHTEPRRKITDVTPRIKHFTVYQEAALGNHYHERTPETFHVTRGEFEIKFEDQSSGKRKTYTVRPGESVEVPLLVAHKVIAKPGTEFINVCGADFDGSDMHKYVIDW